MSTGNERTPVLEFRGVDTHYGAAHILKNVSLEIYPGEMVCLLGGNASGKTTTLKTILGIVEPTRGEVLLDGQVVNGWTSEQLVRAVRHNQQDAQFNPNVRQLLHVGFKVAAKMGKRYLVQLEACEASIARNVTTNLLERHIRPLFL